MAVSDLAGAGNPTVSDRLRPVDNATKVARNRHSSDLSDQVRPGGAVSAREISPLAELRASLQARWEREGKHDAAERQALAAHYAAGPEPHAYQPGDPELLRGFHAHHQDHRQ